MTIRNTIAIARPPEVVFDYITDLAREPEWNDALTAVGSLRGGPPRAGSIYRVRFERVGESLIEYDEFERPVLWTTRATSKRLDVRFTGRIAPRPLGCRVMLETELLPHGILRLVRPLIERAMWTSWERHLAAIKSTLEREEPQSPVTPSMHSRRKSA
jgi:hypothetical protein